MMRQREWRNQPSRMVGLFTGILLLLGWVSGVQAENPKDSDPGIETRKNRGPQLIRQYCFDCHGDGAAEGDFTLDSVATAATDGDPQLWWKVLKNVRARVMPPPDMDQPTLDEVEELADWVKFEVFDIDPDDLDPGRLAVRRLNRVEYENTVNDLMGTRIDASLIFPADDSGHGFDNVGDALSFSPMLMEKYLGAARQIVAEAVPAQTWIVPLQSYRNQDFQYDSGQRAGWDLDGKREQQVSREFTVDQAGTYNVDVGIKLHGSFEFDSARYRTEFLIDGETQFEKICGWDEHKLFEYHHEPELSAGQHRLEFRITPIPPDESEEVVGNGGTFVRLQIDRVTVEGPVGTDKRVHPENYERFFTRPEPPTNENERQEYAAEVLRRFARRAFRSPVPEATVERLVEMARQSYSRPEISFEEGISQAMVAVLTSPRFLFHLEAAPRSEPGERGSVLVDELALASRLSYFLWSTMPDRELIELAEAGRLRQELPTVLERMIQDPRSKQLMRNFVGQWLKTRDVIQKDVDPLVILGAREEYDEIIANFRKRFRRGPPRGELSEEDQRIRERFEQLRAVRDNFDEGLKRAMQRETEMSVEFLLREDRSLLELLDSDYTFLNEKLARHYGIPDVRGDRMRRVSLPDDSPRGGVLGHASMALVTANPTRTSPVKRGLFVLENILGMPAPPAPPGIPELEAAAEQFGDHEPSLRELLEAHRDSALCSSCHSRMDPIGLALENFNALGQWREEDQGQAIHPAGQLITGESFADIRELKTILRDNHARAFYRCVTEKLMVYALGRGVEHYDQESIDRIVQRLEENDGRFRVLLEEVVQSAPFQRQRLAPEWTNTSVSEPAAQR